MDADVATAAAGRMGSVTRITVMDGTGVAQTPILVAAVIIEGYRFQITQSSATSPKKKELLCPGLEVLRGWRAPAGRPYWLGSLHVNLPKFSEL